MRITSAVIIEYTARAVLNSQAWHDVKITPIRRVQHDTDGAVPRAHTACRRAKSEKTVYELPRCVGPTASLSSLGARSVVYLTSPWTCSRDNIQTSSRSRGRRRKIIDSQGRVHFGGSPATALVRYKSPPAVLPALVEEEELEARPMVGMRAPKFDGGPVPIVGDDALSGS